MYPKVLSQWLMHPVGTELNCLQIHRADISLEKLEVNRSLGEETIVFLK